MDRKFEDQTTNSNGIKTFKKGKTRTALICPICYGTKFVDEGYGMRCVKCGNMYREDR